MEERGINVLDFNRHSIRYGMSFLLFINRNARSYCGGKTGYLFKVQAWKLTHTFYQTVQLQVLPSYGKPQLNHELMVL